MPSKTGSGNGDPDPVTIALLAEATAKIGPLAIAALQQVKGWRKGEETNKRISELKDKMKQAKSLGSGTSGEGFDT